MLIFQELGDNNTAQKRTDNEQRDMNGDMNGDRSNGEDWARGKLGEMLDRDRKAVKKKKMLRRLKESSLLRSCVEELALLSLRGQEELTVNDSNRFYTTTDEERAPDWRDHNLDYFFPLTPSRSHGSDSSQFSFDFEETELSLVVCMSSEDGQSISQPRPTVEPLETVDRDERDGTTQDLFERFMVYSREASASHIENSEDEEEKDIGDYKERDGDDQGEVRDEADFMIELLVNDGMEDSIGDDVNEEMVKDKTPNSRETRSLSDSMSAFYSRLQRQLEKTEEMSETEIETEIETEEESSFSSSQHTSACSSFCSPMCHLVIRGYSREGIRDPLYQPEEYGDINVSYRPEQVYEDVIYSYDHRILKCYQDDEWKEFRKLLKKERRRADKNRNKFVKLKTSASTEKSSESYEAVLKFLKRYGSKHSRKRNNRRKKKKLAEEEPSQVITPVASTEQATPETVSTTAAPEKAEDGGTSPLSVVDEPRSIRILERQ